MLFTEWVSNFSVVIKNRNTWHKCFYLMQLKYYRQICLISLTIILEKTAEELGDVKNTASLQYTKSNRRCIKLLVTTIWWKKEATRICWENFVTTKNCYNLYADWLLFAWLSLRNFSCIAFLLCIYNVECIQKCFLKNIFFYEKLKCYTLYHCFLIKVVPNTTRDYSMKSAKKN